MTHKATILDSVKLFEWTAKNLPIRFFGDDALKTQCAEIQKDEFGTQKLKEKANLLTDVLTKYRQHTGMGRGLAANQVGITKRIIAVWLDEKFVVMVNPKLISAQGKGSYWESCISAGAVLIGRIYRPWKGTFEYQDVSGKHHKLQADEYQTRVILHEIDHLNGITCNEKYQPKTLRFISGGKEEVLGYTLKKELE